MKLNKKISPTDAMVKYLTDMSFTITVSRRGYDGSDSKCSGVKVSINSTPEINIHNKEGSFESALFGIIRALKSEADRELAKAKEKSDTLNDLLETS